MFQKVENSTLNTFCVDVCVDVTIPGTQLKVHEAQDTLNNNTHFNS